MTDDDMRALFERALTDETLGATFLHRFMGLKITPDAKETTVEFRQSNHFSNRQGYLHGGIMAFLIDTAMGNLHRAALNAPGVTLELKTQYLSSSKGDGLLVCRARPLKLGSRISFLEATLSSEEGKVIAAATGTWMRADSKP